MTIANQNSAVPKDRLERRFTAVSAPSRTRLHVHAGTCGSHPWTICPPAIASMATIATKAYQ